MGAAESAGLEVDGGRDARGAATGAAAAMTVMSGAAGDEPIVAAIRSGDHRRALALCAREHARALGQLCIALLGSQGEAEDVVQETLLDAHAAFASWRAEGSLRAWLCGIARRKCARQLEQRARRTARLRLVHDGRAGSEGEELVLLRERAERARHALESVRPTEREALVLRYGSGLSFREVAEACGIDEAAARKRVSRALGKLRLAMSEEK